MISVMLVDDQTLIRAGIKSLLGLSERVQVVAEAADGQAALDLLETQNVDVILMDIRMPVLNGIETLRAMQSRQYQTPVLMLTTFDDHQLVLEAIQLGAQGYLLKDVSLETLVEAIERVAGGETMIQPAITERILHGLKSVPTSGEGSLTMIEPLSEKECEILRLMASGYSNREIAEAMFKSEGTVKNQVSAILAKMGVRDRTRAVLKAIEHGLIR